MQRSAPATSRARARTARSLLWADGSASPTAVLDPSGTIVEVNDAWRLFTRLNTGSEATTGVGVDYLEVCDRAAADGEPLGVAAACGLRSVLSGERASFELEYPCSSPIEDRWYRLHITLLDRRDGQGVRAVHHDITSQKVLAGGWAILPDHDAETGLPFG